MNSVRGNSISSGSGPWPMTSKESISYLHLLFKEDLQGPVQVYSRFKGVTLAESHNLVTSSAKWTQLEPLKLEPWIMKEGVLFDLKFHALELAVGLLWSFLRLKIIIIWGNDPKATAGYNSMMNFSGSCMDGLSLSLSQPQDKERKVEM